MSLTLLGAGNSGGGGVALTYTTLNSADKAANVTLSGSDLIATFTSASDGAVRSVSSKTSGKFYVEFTPGGTWSGADNGFGIALGAANITSMGSTVANSAFIYTGANPPLWYNTTFSGVNLKPTGLGTLVGMAVDLDNKKLWVINYSQGNEWNGIAGSNNPATNLGGLDISALFPGAGTFVAVCANQNTASATVNFGSSAFVHTAPSGFTGWTV